MDEYDVVHRCLPNLRFHTEPVVPSRCFCSRTVTWQSEYRPVDITDGALPSWLRVDRDPHHDHQN